MSFNPPPLLPHTPYPPNANPQYPPVVYQQPSPQKDQQEFGYPQQPYGQPQYAQPQYPQPQYPQPQYAQPQYPQPQYSQPQPYGYPQYDQSQYDTYERFAFTSKSIRNAFVRKVYSILVVQLIFTIGIMCLFIFIPQVKALSIKFWYLRYVALGVVLVLMIVLGCCSHIRRQFPLNVILLAVFTLCEGLVLGFMSVHMTEAYILYAGLITLAIVLAITIFAFQTKIDFTYLTGGLIILSVVLMGFGIMLIFFRNKILNLVYCCLGVLLFSAFLLVDTQMMLGPDYHFSLSPEDYVFAALNLYVDIISIFMSILGIFQNSD